MHVREATRVSTEPVRPAKLIDRSHFMHTEVFGARLLASAQKLGLDRSELCRDAVELYVLIVEARPDLDGLDLLVLLRDIRKAAIDSARENPTPPGPEHRPASPPTSAHRPPAPRGRKAK